MNGNQQFFPENLKLIKNPGEITYRLGSARE
jgi:hypothetical protein